MKTWIDISQPLCNDIAVWPGDTPFSYEVSWSKEQSGSVNVGKVTMSTHTGTHVDAPFHFDDDGRKIIDLDIDVFVGKSMVVDVSDLSELTVDDLQHIDFRGAARVLLKTRTAVDPLLFPDTILYIHPEVAPYLQQNGIRLLGLDIPSVDPLDSKDLPTHHALFANGVHILENLVLTHVEPGEYELIALPLPLKDSDGSPVRAVLRPLSCY